jgi:CBS domain-containing protein
MRVAEVMSRGVDPVDPEATVQEAATQMAELDVGAIFVGLEDAITGILTDRDIILRVVVNGDSPAAVRVSDVMSKTVFACKEDDTVETALAIMRERQIRRMPVLNNEGKPIGVVVLSDLAKAVSGPEQVREAIREISEPHRSRKAAPETDETAKAPAGKEGNAGAAAKET